MCKMVLTLEEFRFLEDDYVTLNRLECDEQSNTIKIYFDYQKTSEMQTICVDIWDSGPQIFVEDHNFGDEVSKEDWQLAQKLARNVADLLLTHPAYRLRFLLKQTKIKMFSSGEIVPEIHHL
jgi:hypothetical protein